MEQGWFYHGVWLLEGARWLLVQRTGPQLMGADYAYQVALQDPYTDAMGPPWAWAGLWEWTGGRWLLVESFQNY